MQRVVPVLRVARLDAAERFYTEQLGFTTDWIWRPDAASRGFAQLSRGGLSIYVSDQPDGAPRGSAEVYLYVDDVDFWQGELEAAEVAIETPATTQPWGNRELTLRDPDGNRLTLATPTVTPPG